MSRKPDEAAAGEDREAFLSRWSRRKAEVRQSPPPPADAATDAKAPVPELPPVDKLTIESDYRAFFHPKVGEDVRRAALKKLFGDPRFNVMDGLDVYIDDYSKTEPIPPEMLAGLRQAQKILAWAKEDEEERARIERSKEQPSPKDGPAPAIEPPAPQSARGGPRPDVADTTPAPSASAPKPPTS